MASEFTVDLEDQVTPEDKLGPRVGVGGKLTVSRDTDGAIGLQLRQGDSGSPEAYPTVIRSQTFGPFPADRVVTIELATIDTPMPDFTPRRYQLRVVAVGGGDLTVATRSASIVTEPFAQAGVGP
jgi:hypothetical protein